MRLSSRLITFSKDPLIRGFTLTSVILIGVGLEQDLLPGTHHQSLTFLFLLGNLAGLPIGILVWERLYPKSMLPLAAWPLEGLLTGLCIWKPAPVLCLVLGLVFGLLVTHLIMLALGKDMEYLTRRAGLGIIIGNILIFGLSDLPFPIGLLILSILLASLRVQKPQPLPNHISGKGQWRSLVWFWIFCLCFYTLGGLYNSMEDMSPPNIPSVLFWLICLGCYIAGILLTIFFFRNETDSRVRKLIPFGAVAVMGLAVTIHMSKGPLSIWSMTLMDLSFGLMDCFSVAFLLAFSDHIIQAATGMAIFPASIILGMEMGKIPIHDSLFEYQWALAFLFITLLPLYIGMSELKEDKAQGNTPLALPPGKGTEGPDPSSNPPVSPKENSPFATPKPSLTDLENIAAALGLSEREKDVFLELVSGKKLKEIASDLQLAIGTIKALCSRIYEKAGVKGKKELIEKIRNFKPITR